MVIGVREAFHSARYGLTDLVHNTLFGRPDVIIVGELHTDEGHSMDQAKMIRRYKPKYVLLEGLDGLNPEDTQKLVKAYETATLSDLHQAIGIKPNDTGINEDVLPVIRNEVDREIERTTYFYRENGFSRRKARKEACKTIKGDGVVPRTYRQLLETPLYELNPAVLEVLESLAFEKEMSYASQRDITAAGKFMIVQRALLGFRRNSITGDRMSDRVYHAVAQTNGKLAGCDIKKELPELDEQMGKNPDEETAQRTLLNYLDSLRSYVVENNQQREQEMGNRIVQHVRRRETSSPVITIVGKEHIRRDSGIYHPLEEAGLRYRMVRQKSFRRDSLRDLLYPFQLGVKG